MNKVNILMPSKNFEVHKRSRFLQERSLCYHSFDVRHSKNLEKCVGGEILA